MQIAFNPGVLVGRASPELSLVFSVLAGAPVPGTAGVSSVETRERGRHMNGSHHRPNEAGEVDAVDLDTGDQTSEIEGAELEENPTSSVEEELDEAQLESVPEEPEGEAHDIKDTLEVLIGLQSFYGAIGELTEGDYISGARKVFASFEEYRAAFEGIETVPDELDDLDEEELEALAEQALKIAKAFV